MANLNSLANPHFSRLSHEERFELIRSIRTMRRQVKEEPKKTKLASRAKRPKKTVITNELAGMSQEQLAQLMELLNDGM